MSLRLRHARVELALHELRGGAGRALLVLHGLGEESRRQRLEDFAAWAGPVFGLDFTGHGASSVPRGGGYFPEILMGDADTALRHLGRATLVGRGLGAYVALLLAGARPDAVLGAALCDGPGLAGGGPRPSSPLLLAPPRAETGPPDPFALLELARDPRPPDYATVFVRMALRASPLAQPIRVCARQRPAWLAAVLREPGVTACSPDEALESFGADAASAGQAAG